MHIIARAVKTEEISGKFAERISLLASQLRGTSVIVTRAWLLELAAFPKTWFLIAEVE